MFGTHCTTSTSRRATLHQRLTSTQEELAHLAAQEQESQQQLQMLHKQLEVNVHLVSNTGNQLGKGGPYPFWRPDSSPSSTTAGWGGQGLTKGPGDIPSGGVA